MREKSGNYGVIFFLILALGGTGYYAYQLRTTSSKADADAAQARSDSKACADILDGEKKGHATAGDQLASCTAELETQKTNRAETEKLAADMATNLNATKSELEDLRKEHAENDRRLRLSRPYRKSSAR